MQNAVGVLHLTELRSGLKRIEFQVHSASCGTPLRFFSVRSTCSWDRPLQRGRERPGRARWPVSCWTPPERWFPGTILAFRALEANGCEVQILIATYQLHETAAG